MSKQPRDDANSPIPVLGLRPSSGQQISLSNVAATSAAFHPSTRVITIYPNVDCFIELGGIDVVANFSNSHVIPAGYIFDIAISSDLVPVSTTKHLSAISYEPGILYISERQ